MINFNMIFMIFINISCLGKEKSNLRLIKKMLIKELMYFCIKIR